VEKTAITGSMPPQDDVTAMPASASTPPPSSQAEAFAQLLPQRHARPAPAWQFVESVTG